MPPLADLPIKLSYRTGRDDMVKDFFIPCLESSTLYQRAAGYFTSYGLALAARGVASLISRDGKMRLVVSPHLDPEDIEALSRANDRPLDTLTAIAARSLDDIENALVKDRLNALAWLAATGGLEIRLALRVDENGSFMKGIFHEKIGIFSDLEGNKVTFSGSSNETAGGLVENFESIKAFCSWRDDKKWVDEELDNFENLWADKTPGLKVIEFSEAGGGLIERYLDKNRPPLGISKHFKIAIKSAIDFKIPPTVELRPYQLDAINSWIHAKGNGIFAMATGTGKTITALALASKVANKNKPFVLIVVCPYINLCKQWIREMRLFGLQAISCFESASRWQANYDEAYQELAVGLTTVQALVVTNATFVGDGFQARLRQKLAANIAHHMLIADEVHNLGAERINNALPDEINLRLGLSATPERYQDPVGTSIVLNYFGNVVYEYSLSQAIKDGRLSTYRYYPIAIELTDEEAEKYMELTAKLARLLPGGDIPSEIKDVAMGILMKRARLIAGAVNKIKSLDKIISERGESISKAIFYCGDGKTTDTINDADIKQIQAVSRVLGERHGLRVRTFTFRETPEEREEILRDLSSGFLDGIVAIRCLDEGIDLPELRVGFLLASSTNPRQFIQRRGRLLRKSPGKDRAEIYDFFVHPPFSGEDVDAKTFNIERSLFSRELSRIIDFCATAENGPEALRSIQDLRIRYNLLSS